MVADHKGELAGSSMGYGTNSLSREIGSATRYHSTVEPTPSTHHYAGLTMSLGGDALPAR